MYSSRCIVHRLSERKMDKRNYMTTEQLHAETETLSKVFDMVRVLDKQALDEKMRGIKGNVPLRDGNCHNFWKTTNLATTVSYSKRIDKRSSLKKSKLPTIAHTKSLHATWKPTENRT